MTRTIFMYAPIEKEQIMIKEIANAYGRLKVFPNINYRNGLETPVLDGNLVTRLNKLGEITISNNKDEKTLKNSMFESGFDISQKPIKVMDLVDVMKCGANSNEIKELRNLYKEDLKFIDEMNAIASIFENADSYENDENLFEELSRHVKKYFVVIGGYTRVFLCRARYIEKEMEAIKDGSAELKLDIVVETFRHFEKKNNMNISCYRSLSNEQRQDYHKLHCAQLLLLIMEDNSTQISNIPIENVMNAKGVLGEALVLNKSLVIDEGTEKKWVREILCDMKNLYNDIKGLNHANILEGMIYRITSKYVESHEINNFNQNEVKFFAKTLSQIIGLKEIKVNDRKTKNKKEYIPSLLGLDFESLKIEDARKFEDMMYFVKEAHKCRTNITANEVANEIKKEMLSKVRRQSEVVLKRCDQKEILKALKNEANKDNSELNKNLKYFHDRFSALKKEAEKNLDGTIEVEFTVKELNDLIKRAGGKF